MRPARRRRLVPGRRGEIVGRIGRLTGWQNRLERREETAIEEGVEEEGESDRWQAGVKSLDNRELEGRLRREYPSSQAIEYRLTVLREGWQMGQYDKVEKRKKWLSSTIELGTRDPFQPTGAYPTPQQVPKRAMQYKVSPLPPLT